MSWAGAGRERTKRVFIFWVFLSRLVMASAFPLLRIKYKFLMVVLKSSCQVATPYKPLSQRNPPVSPNPLFQLHRPPSPQPPCSFCLSPNFCTFAHVSWLKHESSPFLPLVFPPTSLPLKENWGPTSSRKPPQIADTLIYFPAYHRMWGWGKLHSHWHRLSVDKSRQASSCSKVVLKIHNTSVCTYK